MKIQVIKYDSVDSTNNIAIRRIKKGKIKPALIIANLQKKGRGQYGRKWVSQRGNIFMTIYFNFKKKMTVKSLSKKVYKIIKQSLEKFVYNKITIKLPNDLLIDGSKVCGILQETITYNNNKFFVVGIGINLIKSPKIVNKHVSFLQKYNNNKIKKTDIYKKIKNNFEKFI
jgi:BirA family biotin operon repressor/biotin-[acetyl-CoA-carboxylase] ligase|tara:strand:- start:979 stop:1491 length:513 start_codon:yes stop_codon:yes gene_type:complete